MWGRQGGKGEVIGGRRSEGMAEERRLRFFGR